MKILIAALCGVGDLILFLPHLRRLREIFPAARIDMLIMPNGAQPLMTQAAPVDNVVVYDDHRMQFHRSSKLRDGARRWKVLYALRRQRYDLCVWPFAGTTLRKRLLAAVINARRTLMHCAQNSSDRWGGVAGLTLIPYAMTQHVFERNTDLLKGVPVPTADLQLGLDIRKEDREYAMQALQRKISVRGAKMFGFHPCSNTKWTSDKQWPAEYYARLADLLSKKFHTVSVLLGAPYEKAYLASLTARMTTPVVEMSELHLLHMAALISQLDLLIGNESSLVHIGGVLGVPTVVIQGPTSHARTGALGERAHIVRLDLPCSPCFDIGFTAHCTHHRCMHELTPDVVFQAICGILDHPLLPPAPRGIQHFVHNLPVREDHGVEWAALMNKRRAWGQRFGGHHA